MTKRYFAGIHVGADADRLRAQGIECPFQVPHAVVISTMPPAAQDLYLANVSRPIREVVMLAPAKQWDWQVELPPHLKAMRALKLDRVVVVFEDENEASNWRPSEVQRVGVAST